MAGPSAHPAHETLTPASALPERTGREECWVRLNSDSLHDLMGPVNQMGTITELILKKYGGQLDPEAEALLGFIKSSSGRLQNLAGGLTTYLRMTGSPGTYGHWDAGSLLAGARVSLQSIIDLTGAMLTHDRLPEIYCEPNQMGFVFKSLLDNSLKFRSQPRPEIHVSARQQENVWLFSVRDNGIGIDPAQCDRVFGLFKRIHNEEFPGAGVGLTIARQIVEQHGGRIWVESQRESGATFFFTLPQPR